MSTLEDHVSAYDPSPTKDHVLPPNNRIPLYARLTVAKSEEKETKGWGIEDGV